MKEIKSLYIKNFQTHQETYIEFCNGLNVFVGRSRNGKTAIIRALRWLYHNEPRGDKHIRVGEKRCEVAVELIDGTKVERIRDDKFNGYVLTLPGQKEEPFTKFKTEVPLEIQQALGVSKVWLDKDTSIELNFARQMESAFMVTDSAPRRAKIIGRVMNLHIIDSAERTATNELQAAQRRKAEINLELEDLHSKLADYADLHEKESALARAQALMTRIDVLECRLGKLQEIYESIVKTEKAIHDNNQELALLINLEDAEDRCKQVVLLQNRLFSMVATKEKIDLTIIGLKTVADTIYKLNGIRDAECHLARLNGLLAKQETLETLLQSVQRSEQAQLEAAKTIEILKDADVSCDLLSKIKCQYNQMTQLEQIKTQIEEAELKRNELLAITEKLREIDNGQDMIVRLKDLRERGYTLSNIRASVTDINSQLILHRATIAKIGDLGKIDEAISKAKCFTNRLELLQDLFSRVTNLEAKTQNRRDELSVAQLNYNRLLDEYTEILGKVDVCPVCHTAMTPDLIHQLASCY